MGQRFGRIIAANSASTTTTPTPIIPYMCKQAQQQQTATTISTLNFTSTTHDVTELNEEEQQFYVNTIVPTSNGSAIATIKAAVTTTTTISSSSLSSTTTTTYATIISGRNIITAGCNSNSRVNLNNNQQDNEEEKVTTVPLSLCSNDNNTYNRNNSNNGLLSINNLSLSGSAGGDGCGGGGGGSEGDRQIYIKIQLTKMESGKDITIIDNNIPNCSNSCTTSSDVCSKQLNNMAISNINEETEGVKCELINVNSLETTARAVTTMIKQTTDNNCNAEGISKNFALGDSIAVNFGFNATLNPHAYIEDDNEIYNLPIDRTLSTIHRSDYSKKNNTNNTNNSVNNNVNSLFTTYECDNNNECQQACLHYHNQKEEREQQQQQYYQQSQNTDDPLEIKEMTEYCTVLKDDLSINNPIVNLRSTTNNLQSMKVAEANFCCRKRRSKSAMSRMTQSSSKKDHEATVNALEMATVDASIRRCCKCSCRDVFRRILDPASSRLTMKSLKHQRQQQQYRVNTEELVTGHSKYYLTNKSNKSNKNSNNNSIKYMRSKQECVPESRTNCKNTNKIPQPQCRLNLNCNAKQSIVTTSSSMSPTTITTTMYNKQKPTATTTITRALPRMVTSNGSTDSIAKAISTTIAAVPNQLLIQAVPPTTVNVDVPLVNSCSRDEIIRPISTSQFVIVQCAFVDATDTITKPPPQVSKLVAAATIIAGVSANQHVPIATSTTSLCLNNTPSMSSPNHIDVAKQLIGTTTITSVTSKVDKLFTSRCCNSTTPTPAAHSQIDFRHFLVPDLERITNASFYWGKMDRYEAERLLDDKSEGTFLLRDSAQEEFLFSVSFRKYGRSLHARIEQSGHRFSFDCHDPGVYTAPTVMGLLEHYKDPTCVMFFEPMLTTPLNREFCFSLQQLCRATIVSNISSYDGISELDLPARMKLYLKEYHYKQKLRVKPFDELLYASSCT